MKPGQGKNKGSNFEREVGRYISLWLSNGERDDLASRTECSGGKFTATGKGSPGDLNSSHPICYPFFEAVLVECKCWASLGLYDFLMGRGELLLALKKTVEQAEKIQKYPLMVVRQNRSHDLFIGPPLPCFESLPVAHYCFGKSYTLGKLMDFLKLDCSRYLEECKVYLESRKV